MTHPPAWSDPTLLASDDFKCFGFYLFYFIFPSPESLSFFQLLTLPESFNLCTF